MFTCSDFAQTSIEELFTYYQHNQANSDCVELNLITIRSEFDFKKPYFLSSITETIRSHFSVTKRGREANSPPLSTNTIDNHDHHKR